MLLSEKVQLRLEDICGATPVAISFPSQQSAPSAVASWSINVLYALYVVPETSMSFNTGITSSLSEKT